MKLKLIALACCSAAMAAGCSYTPAGQAQGSFEYTDVQQRPELQAADGLNKPVSTNRYEIPPVPASEPVGTEVDINAPVVVWPLADGSRVEETEQLPRIYFDELEGMTNISDYVWNSALQGLQARNIGVAAIQDKQVISTDWLTTQYQIGENETPLQVQRRFNLIMESAPHGRTASLLVEVAERQDKGPTIGEVLASKQDRDAAAGLLNQVVSEIAIMQYQGVGSLTEDGTLAIDAGFDDEGSPAMVLGASFNFSWTLMASVVEELGFEIDDLNQSTGRYYLDYDKDKSGASSLAFWRSSKEGKLDIANGSYELKVTGDRRRTTLTFFTNGEAFSAAELNRIFAPVAAEIKRQSEL
ncbi:outer membrane protein assembly factor BamC [Pseudidiomarina sp. GXY010]|uniref:Outer membrane protein assembly factor BamC n=1 Tax=Pseudidiomarina fusca TaxID=2965078 RepID=A0ABU3KU55_9GAMM|nr:outer membrane protein assembly factor BamC [Pseudidiomarina sp. GXY010]MDT7524717.1 outer membrane protein assembly factor BamC [Pseudidiomarina sp. GXY010]